MAGIVDVDVAVLVAGLEGNVAVDDNAVGLYLLNYARYLQVVVARQLV